MFSDIKTIVDTVKAAVGAFQGFRNNKSRESTILDLLRIYFVLKDVVEDGRYLLENIGEDPEKKLYGIDPEQVEETIKNWDCIARKQASRLDLLGVKLLGQDVLAVVEPRLKDRLEDIVSSKFERADSLHGIGAALVIYSMFGNKEDREWMFNVIRSMYSEKKNGILDIKKAKAEIDSLEISLEEFRQVCLTLAKKDEILRFSQRARKETEYQSGRV